MALDTSGNWVAGDDLRVIEALGLPFGSYTVTCVQGCMNELEDIELSASLNVRAILDRYEAAKTAQITADLSDTDGKTLVKADVLEWEKNNGSDPSGLQTEMLRAQDELERYFAFCSCASGLLGAPGVSTSLIRS